MSRNRSSIEPVLAGNWQYLKKTFRFKTISNARDHVFHGMYQYINMSVSGLDNFSTVNPMILMDPVSHLGVRGKLVFNICCQKIMQNADIDVDEYLLVDH